MSTSTKRPRTHSSSRSSSNSSTTATSPPPKSSRTIPGSPTSSDTATESHPLLCTLPPTCHRRPTPIAHSKDLEAHYAKYHAHVCEEQGCGCVFPDERLLSLHQTECHDTLAAIRKDRGEKIFACHLASCSKLFATPKTRRLHLIQAHGYPKEYFFAVTNKGIGGLLKKWGDGASLIRGQWRPRENGVRLGGQASEPNISTARMATTGDDSDESDEKSGGGRESVEMEVDAKDVSDRADTTPKASAKASKSLDDAAMDKITDSLSSLSLIPSSVRFGRGGKPAGFGHATNGTHDIPSSNHALVSNGHATSNAPVNTNSPHNLDRQSNNSQHQRHTSGAGSEGGQTHPDLRGRGSGRGRGGRGIGPVPQVPPSAPDSMAVDKAHILEASPRTRGVIHLGEYRGSARGAAGRGRGRGRARGL